MFISCAPLFHTYKIVTFSVGVLLTVSVMLLPLLGKCILTLHPFSVFIWFLFLEYLLVGLAVNRCFISAFFRFDEFNLIRQAILLTIETFGFSLILPIFGLPLLVTYNYHSTRSKQPKRLFFMQLSQVSICSLFSFVVRLIVISLFQIIS